jgi:hypothetical protein
LAKNRLLTWLVGQGSERAEVDLTLLVAPNLVNDLLTALDAV